MKWVTVIKQKTSSDHAFIRSCWIVMLLGQILHQLKPIPRSICWPVKHRPLVDGHFLFLKKSIGHPITGGLFNSSDKINYKRAHSVWKDMQSAYDKVAPYVFFHHHASWGKRFVWSANAHMCIFYTAWGLRKERSKSFINIVYKLLWIDNLINWN